jgi:uncharacterized protein
METNNKHIPEKFVTPAFPNFKKIEITDKAVIENFTRQFPPYNDFDFMSLWTYNTDNKNAFSILNDNLVIKIQDFITGELFYSFIGKNNIDATISTLLMKSEEDNFGPELKLIPEINLQSSPDLEKNFFIKEDPDNFDYILSVEELASLKGNKYYDKRNLVNRFKKLYPNHSIMRLDLTNKKTEQAVKELFFLWEQQKDKSRIETQIELTAIERLFDLTNVLKVMGTGVYIHDRLIGFCTYHVAQDNFAIFGFEKGDISYEGIYAYLNHQAAIHLETLGSSYINFEQDLGIPGLHKAKQLWRPVKYLKKFKVSKKI